jgi:hypothetical protein
VTLKLDVYTLEAREGAAATPYPESEFWTMDYQEAQAEAQDKKLRVIGNTYEWADSELLDDYTEDPEPDEDEPYFIGGSTIREDRLADRGGDR